MKRTATHLVLSAFLLTGLGVFFSGNAAATPKRKPVAKSSARHTAVDSSKTTGTRRTKSAKSTSSRARGKKRDVGQKAPAPDRISEIQNALSKNGHYNGAPNGKWDDSTVSAMRDFQAAHGLNPSGKLDAKTLQQLGLGSQTAGVAAPVPMASSSNVNPAQAPAVRSQNR